MSVVTTDSNVTTMARIRLIHRFAVADCHWDFWGTPRADGVADWLLLHSATSTSNSCWHACCAPIKTATKLPAGGLQNWPWQASFVGVSPGARIASRPGGEAAFGVIVEWGDDRETKD